MKIEAIVGSTAYDLSNITEFMFQEESDLGMAPVKRLTEAGPLQHGASDVGFRLQPRKLRLKVATNSDDGQTLDTRRAKLLSIFKPRLSELKILKTLDSGARRQIDCYFSSGLTFRSSDRKGMVQVEVIELLAPDPTFYDPTPVAVYFGLAGGTATGYPFAIPLEIPWNVGSSTLRQGRDVTYAGTWQSEPIVTIYGPITDAVVTNLTIGAKLDFTGATINAGDWVVVDTRYGHKSVTGGSGENRIADMTDDSDLATFRMESAPDAPGGVNSFNVTGIDVSEATQVYLSYYTRYVGI